MILHKNVPVMKPKQHQTPVSSWERGQVSFREGAKPKHRLCFFLVVCLGGVLAVGNWAVFKYDQMWASARVWVQKVSLGERTTGIFGLNGSHLGNPWSKVSSYFVFHSQMYFSPKRAMSLLKSRIFAIFISTTKMSKKRQAKCSCLDCAAKGTRLP